MIQSRAKLEKKPRTPRLGSSGVTEGDRSGAANYVIRYNMQISNLPVSTAISIENIRMNETSLENLSVLKCFF